MIKYALLSLTLLAIIPFLTLDISAQTDPEFTYYTNQYYTDKIDSPTLITYDDIKFLYNTLPTCHSSLQKVHSQKVSMEPNGDLTLSFTIYKHDFTSGKVYLIIKYVDGDSSNSISLTPVHDSTSGYYSTYRATIPKSLIPTDGKFSLTGHFFDTSDTIPKSGIFSNVTGGSPLYHYTQNPKFIKSSIIMELPDADDVTFTPGSITGITGDLFTPDSNTVSLESKVPCKFGIMESPRFAIILDKDPKTTGVEKGIQFKFKFKEERPNQINWIVTDSNGNIVRGNTDEPITKKFTFTIPLNTSGTYDIVTFGTKNNNQRIIGVHTSSHTFTTESNTPTPPKVNLPSLYQPDSDAMHRVFSIKTEDDSTTGYIPTSTGGDRYINTPKTYASPPPVGDIFIPDSVHILSNSIFEGDVECNAQVASSAQIIDGVITGQVAGFVAPDNIKPNDPNKSPALGINFFNTPTSTCTIDLEATSENPLITTKEMYVTLYGKGDKKPYFFSPREDIRKAQPIPACTNDHIYRDNQTLKDNTMMCYGTDDNSDMVIITKRLTGFYGAANRITVPANPIDLTTGNSPQTIPSPENFPNPNYAVFRFVSEPNVDTAYLIGSSEDGHSYTHIASSDDTANIPNRIGDFFFQDDTTILSNSIFPTGNEEVLCSALVRDIQYAMSYNLVPGLAIPNNITPKDNLVAIGIDFYNLDQINDQCSPDLEASSTNPLVTNKEIRVTLYEKSDKKPYYFSPREGVTLAQSIPACTADNYDKSDQTLKGDTEMCYGVNDDNIVIITKRLTGFYGAADSIT